MSTTIPVFNKRFYTLNECLIKADQHWDMAGLARQDGDNKDANRHTQLAKIWTIKASEGGCSGVPDIKEEDIPTYTEIHCVCNCHSSPETYPTSSAKPCILCKHVNSEGIWSGGYRGGCWVTVRLAQTETTV